VTLFLVVGPPAGGKSTWVGAHAKPGDITVDYDALANVLSPGDSDRHDHSAEVKAVTKACRQAAIDTAVGMRDRTDVYVIHSTPSKETLHKYLRQGAQVIVVDPGCDVVFDRARHSRPGWMHGAIKRWYDETSKYVEEANLASVPSESTWAVPSW
jgi:predicted kinase